MPKHLYRYRTFNQNSLSELIHGEMYFSSPSSFNDPFDCNNMFSFDGATDEHWRIFLEKFLSHNRPQLTPEERRQEIDTIIASGAHREKESLALQYETWGGILSKMNEGLGVACLSSKCDDILMWSHYGNCHKGFCLVFNRELLQPNFSCQEINYRADYPTFGELVTNDFGGIARTFLLTKSDHWRYESEYRLLVDPKLRTDKPGDRSFPIPEGALIGLIYGCQMPVKDRQTIFEIATRKWPHLHFYEAIKSLNAYLLRIVQVR